MTKMSRIEMKICLLLGILSVSYGFPTVTHDVKNDEWLDLARQILEEVPLIDGHNDLPWNLQTDFDGQLSLVDLEADMCQQFVKHVSNCHTDIPRMREGMVGAQFWSVYTRCNTQYKDGTERALDLIDLIERFTRKYNYFFKMAYSSQDIIDAHAQGLVSSLIGIEGGHMVQNSLGVLRMLYSVGARYLSLTWNCNTPWADNNDPDGDTETLPNGGLSDWGKRLVREMNRLGMIVDLSHVSDDTMRDALNVSIAPVIFSHSSVYSLCPHQRNVPDDVLLQLKENGGVVMITFVTKFINCTEDNAYESGARAANISQVVEHMEYVRDFIGVDHVGIGSDFDGTTNIPNGIEDTSKFPDLVAEMLRRGWSEDDVKQVVGLNIIRLFQQVEQVRDELGGTQADETLIDYEIIPDLSCKNLPDWDASFFSK